MGRRASKSPDMQEKSISGLGTPNPTALPLSVVGDEEGSGLCGLFLTVSDKQEDKRKQRSETVGTNGWDPQGERVGEIPAREGTHGPAAHSRVPKELISFSVFQNIQVHFPHFPPKARISTS